MDINAVILVETKGVVTKMQEYVTYRDARKAFMDTTARVAPLGAQQPSQNIVEWGDTRLILVSNTQVGLLGRGYTDEVMERVLQLRR